MFNNFFTDLTIVKITKMDYEEEQYESTYILYLESASNPDLVAAQIEVSREFVQKHGLINPDGSTK